jgi:hypothetical protein
MGAKDRLRQAARRAVVRGPFAELVGRVRELEADVAELRAQNLRLAELADVLQELVVPLASRDQERIDAAIARFNKGI